MYLYCRIGHLEKALQYVRYILAGILKKRNTNKWENSWIRKYTKIVKAKRKNIAIDKNDVLKRGPTTCLKNINIRRISLIITKNQNNERNNLGGFFSIINGLSSAEFECIKFTPMCKKDTRKKNNSNLKKNTVNILEKFLQNQEGHVDFTGIAIGSFILYAALCFKFDIAKGIPLFLVFSVLIYLFGRWVHEEKFQKDKEKIRNIFHYLKKERRKNRES